MLFSRNSLQVMLWTIWTGCVSSMALYQWHHDALRHLPFNVIAMIIHCVLVGVIGLLVIIFIELRLEPQV